MRSQCEVVKGELALNASIEASSRMKLYMQREALAKLNRHANEMPDLVAKSVPEHGNSGTIAREKVTNSGFTSRKSSRIN